MLATIRIIMRLLLLLLRLLLLLGMTRGGGDPGKKTNGCVVDTIVGIV
jgi:hypothetical protein